MEASEAISGDEAMEAAMEAYGALTPAGQKSAITWEWHQETCSGNVCGLSCTLMTIE